MIITSKNTCLTIEHLERIIFDMGIIAPPSVGRDKEIKSAKTNKAFLREALVASMREIVTTEDGRKMTAAQAGAERLRNIFLYAESNTDSIAAGKLIFERVYGKAAVEKTEETKEMPKVVFALSSAGIEKLNEAARSPSLTDSEDDDAKVLVQTDDGKEYLA